MPETLKVLGQAYPVVSTLTTLYTVPAATSTAISSVKACNQSSATKALIRLSLAVAGAADESKQYLYYDVELLANETRTLSIGGGLATTDVLRCYSSTGLVSFICFGVEVT